MGFRSGRVRTRLCRLGGEACRLGAGYCNIRRFPLYIILSGVLYVNRRLWLCVVGFTVLCIGVMMFLQTFMRRPESIKYVEFHSITQVGEDGSETTPPVDEYGMVAGIEDGAVYRFRAEVEDIPEFGYLELETSGVELTVRMDGELVLQSAGLSPFPMDPVNIGLAHIPLPPEAERCHLEIDYQVLDPEDALYPPMVRVTSTRIADGIDMAFANRYGIPAGCYMLVFLIVCGLFLLGTAQGRPDYTLLLPALASGLLGVSQISTNCGYYFLPAAIHGFWEGPGFRWMPTVLRLLPAVLLLVWLLLGRKRGTWRLLGWSALVAGTAALCVYLASLAGGGLIAGYIREALVDFFWYGAYAIPLDWLTTFLLFDSAAIAAFGVLRDFTRMEADAQALAVQNKLTLENYHAVEEKLQQTAALRHEWKNQVAALYLLQQKGDLEELGRHLERLDIQLDQLSPRLYSAHMAINTILQNGAARAGTLGVAFRASAPVPAELGIREDDLCSLLFNLLDNALEAASQVPPPGGREVECAIRVRQGYLAVKCENTYAGELPIDEDGELQSTKADQDSHGFGLLQMRTIAKKYGSVLDISYTEDRFTVQAALKLPKSGKGP